jgi:peptidoglycan/LPS O-acetylase OafA/YrhL
MILGNFHQILFCQILQAFCSVLSKFSLFTASSPCPEKPKEFMKNPRNVAIDLMRGTSVLYIVGYWHLFNYTNVFPGYINALTSRLTIIVLGVFVLISGYLIGAKEIPLNKNDILIFYRTRLLRIYPPFIVAIILFYILKISDGIALAKSAALISLFSPPAPPTLWFVTMIVMFYLIAPLLIKMSSFSTSKYSLFCLLLIAVVYAFFMDSMDVRIAMYFPVFATGILLANHETLVSKLNIIFMALSLIVSIIISCNSIAPLDKNILSMPLALFGSLLIFVFAVRRKNEIGQHMIISVLSYASLFMYLFHRPLFKIFLDLHMPRSSTREILYLLTVCLPLIIAISWLGQKAYDRLIVYLTKYFAGG